MGVWRCLVNDKLNIVPRFFVTFFIVAGEREATVDHTIMRKKLSLLLLAALLCIPALTNAEPVTFNSGGLQYTSISDTEVMLVGPRLSWDLWVKRNPDWVPRQT